MALLLACELSDMPPSPDEIAEHLFELSLHLREQGWPDAADLVLQAGHAINTPVARQDPAAGPAEVAVLALAQLDRRVRMLEALFFSNE